MIPKYLYCHGEENNHVSLPVALPFIMWRSQGSPGNVSSKSNVSSSPLCPLDVVLDYQVARLGHVKPYYSQQKLCPGSTQCMQLYGMAQKKNLCFKCGFRNSAPTGNSCSAGVGEHFEEKFKVGESLQRGQGDLSNDLGIQIIKCSIVRPIL